MKTIVTVTLLFVSASLFGQNKAASETKTETLNCQLVEKPFINKVGNTSEHKELYLRCSIQDYFIKLCESDVSQDELSPFLDDSISVEVEIIEGNWDICPGDPAHMQSRTGKYVVIKKVNE